MGFLFFWFMFREISKKISLNIKKLVLQYKASLIAAKQEI